jgi:hypothetical protein
VFSLIAFMAALGALDVMALRHGADSRRDVGRRLQQPTRGVMALAIIAARRPSPGPG